MKANRIFKTSDSSLNWQTIMKEASNYKYVVMYRDHYQGNGKGEFFAADRLAALKVIPCYSTTLLQLN